MTPIDAGTATEPSAFDLATRLEDGSDGVPHGEIRPGWDILGNANGGYLLAMAGQGLRRIAGRPDPVSVTAHFLAPGPTGPATVHGEVVKSGKRLTTVTGSLRQGDRRLLEVLGTFGDLASTADGWTHLEGGPPDMPPFEECIRREAAMGVAPALMDRLDVRLRPGDEAFQRGEKTGTATICGWFAFADGRPADTLSLLFVADAFPPPVFNIDIPPGWVPTVELTVHIRAVPAPGPLACRFATRFVQGGYLEEDGEVWDSTGRLVAMSRQLALVPRL